MIIFVFSTETFSQKSILVFKGNKVEVVDSGYIGSALLEIPGIGFLHAGGFGRYADGRVHNNIFTKKCEKYELTYWGGDSRMIRISDNVFREAKYPNLDSIFSYAKNLFYINQIGKYTVKFYVLEIYEHSLKVRYDITGTVEKTKDEKMIDLIAIIKEKILNDQNPNKALLALGIILKEKETKEIRKKILLNLSLSEKKILQKLKE